MSAYINSFLIEPVVRQARRFSFPFSENEATASDGAAGPLSESSNGHAQAAQPPPSRRIPRDSARGQDTSLIRLALRQESQEQARRSLMDTRRSYSASPGGPGTDLATVSNIQDGPPASEEVYEGQILTDSRPMASPPPMDDVQALTDSSSSLGRAGEATADSFRAMSLDGPAAGPPDDQRRTASDASMQSRPDRSSLESVTRRSVGQPSRMRDGSTDSASMSQQLPEDDGMKSLRDKLHEIRSMALSSEEKAMRMHALMMADYKMFKVTQAREHGLELGPARQTLSKSSSPDSSLQGAYNITPDDLKPTYRPSTPNAEGRDAPGSRRSSEEQETDTTLGCRHYKRNVKIQCFGCRRWYTCRLCHDEVEDHTLNRKQIQNMLCMLCGHAQPAAEYCQKCGELTAAYYCDICKLWDNDTRRSIYHCDDCGICRRGEGIGKDYVHCKTCNVCISIAWAATHRCVERATECDCPICGDYMFTSSASVVAMKCGHYIHRKCYDEYMQTSYKCPICNRSAVNMELQWRKLDQEVRAQPMPEAYSETRAWVSCNDCSARCVTRYHWVGNKCSFCDSYNTNLLRVINPPDQPTAAEEELAAPAADLAAADVPAEPAALHRAQSDLSSHDGDGEVLSDAIAPSAEPTGLPPPEDALAQEPDAPGIPDADEAAMSFESLRAPHSPATVGSSTAVGSPPSPIGLPTPSRSPDGIDRSDVARGKARATAAADDADTDADDDDDDDDDDIGFWGAGISPPAGWSISPPAWASPSFFATRWSKDDADVDVDGDDDVDGEESMEEVEDDSSDDDVVGWDDDEEPDDDMELIGHR